MDRLVGLALTIAVRLCSWLSVAGGRRLAKVLVWIVSRVGSEPERITRINLQRCFPHLDDAALERLIRESLQHTLCVAIENGMLTHWSEQRIRDAIVSETGRELLEEQLAKPRGVLLLVPHFGNWEVIGCALGALRFVALYDPPRIASLDSLIRHSRERFGGTLVPVDRNGLRNVYKTLKDDGLVCLLPDQVPEQNAGEYAPFFGQPALTMTLAHRLIQRTNPFVMLGSVRRSEEGFAIDYVPLGREIYADDARDCLKAINRAIERLVLTDPAQYQWEYKRFKKQPEGHALVYPKAR